jgi:protein-disulfide isomerase
MNEIIQEAKIEDSPEKEMTKKMQNIISLAVLLGGLFVGSLFVDIIQLVSGNGFSSRKLQEAGILETAGKTWVAFDQPIVKVNVFSDENCTECKTEEVLLWLRKVIPTIEAQKVDVGTVAGRELADKFEIKTIPGFVFGKEIEKMDFFQKAQNVFTLKNDGYVLNAKDAGIPVGKYLELPVIEEQDARIGKDDAKVKLIEFSDFQCPYCKTLHDSLKKVLAEVGGDVQLVYKHLPLDIHPQANNAALAAACASEQGKFEEYGDKLFAIQSDWSSTSGTGKFKTYAAQLKLNVSDFNKCLDNKKYQDLIRKDSKEAEKFGITGTPAIFINGQFKNGAVSLEELKSLIEGELGK